MNSLIGVVRHSGVSPRTVEMLYGVQARLVGAMGELASLEEEERELELLLEDELELEEQMCIRDRSRPDGARNADKRRP